MQIAIKLENISNLITSPFSYQCRESIFRFLRVTLRKKAIHVSRLDPFQTHLYVNMEIRNTEDEPENVPFMSSCRLCTGQIVLYRQ